MKRLIFFATFLGSALTASAGYYDYGYSRHEGASVGSVIMFILLLVVAVLQIILFFKLWRMTNEVHDFWKSQAPSVPNDCTKLEFMRLSAVTGNMDFVRKEFLTHFYYSVKKAFEDSVNGHYEDVKETDKDGKDVIIRKFISNKDECLTRSIQPFKDKLEQQLKKIGEELPERIQQMETYRDFYSVVLKEDIE